MIINQHNVDYSSLYDGLRKIEDCYELSPNEAKKYNLELKEGRNWRISTEIFISGQLKNLDLLIHFPVGFPFDLHKIFIDPEFYEEVKYIPHVEQNLSICLFDPALIPVVDFTKIGELLEYSISRAKRIISDGVDHSEYRIKEFEREIKAYWEMTYSKKDICADVGFHSIKKLPGAPCFLKGLKIVSNNSFLSYYLPQNDTDLESYKAYLSLTEKRYSEIEILFIKIPFQAPPYDFTIEESFTLIQSQEEVWENFKKYTKKRDWSEIVVAFPVQWEDQHQIFGWTYSNPGSEIPGFRKRKSKLELGKIPLIGNQLVKRLSFENISLERLQRRTAGVEQEQLSVAISGLGSVGSNLTFFLSSLPFKQFHLIDNEALRVANINRHYLGFASTGQPKAEALGKLLKENNPLRTVAFKNESIINVMNTEPEFIDGCDYHFLAVGMSSIERFVLSQFDTKRLTKPTFILWVEPFLASGQLIYFTSEYHSKVDDLIKKFPFHILDEEEIQRDKTYMIEGGCQSGYFPYSSDSLIMFLSAVFPEIRRTVIKKEENSFVLSWIGDKEYITGQGLKLSKFGKDTDSFSLIKNIL